MRAGGITTFIAIVLTVLCFTMVFSACDGDCQSDDHYGCQGTCCHPISLAAVGKGPAELSPTSAGIATDQSAYLARLAIADVFHPPNALS